ncbi:UPF0346 protein YozE [Siminovitchia terrae]|uniref:UPF0346 protein D5F11_018650 n=1 Tax=Siminovitchia terrae TaxID=1914933 RepID=A0A429X4G7_SIMTE|nr:YozE family protein [Siminovitchia terrae]RST58285.1 YozE family protein [Siminovitchia terrae]GIN91964.1 UPF0346 protein YozE [Siminovitchia terrae]GIN99066.1 UPF0346 protein YozE [Siminovitchia terrae]
MKKSFYHFLLKYRQPDSRDYLSSFAEEVYKDHGFPKDSLDYYEISDYLELNGSYQTTLSVFDEAWELYLEAENKK